jgi:cytochrome c
MNSVSPRSSLKIASVLLPLVVAAPSPGTSQEAPPTQPTQGHDMMTGQQMMSPGLTIPIMDAERGRKLFASKGCVVCHAVNGVGGQDALPLDAATMPPMMNPFDFTANMWRGAEAMVMMQREEMGEQIELTGDELADIIAFVHHAEEQREFSEADIPENIKALMRHLAEE